MNVQRSVLPAETRRHIALRSGERQLIVRDFTARENLEFFTRLTGKRLDRRDYYQAMRRVGHWKKAERGIEDLLQGNTK